MSPPLQTIYRDVSRLQHCSPRFAARQGESEHRIDESCRGRVAGCSVVFGCWTLLQGGITSGLWRVTCWEESEDGYIGVVSFTSVVISQPNTLSTFDSYYSTN